MVISETCEEKVKVTAGEDVEKRGERFEFSEEELAKLKLNSFAFYPE